MSNNTLKYAKIPFNILCDLVVQFRGVTGGGELRGLELSCHAMTSYEHCLATHVVTLASCKLEFTVLELAVATIYHAAHINQQQGFKLALFRVWEGPHAFQRPILQRSLISSKVSMTAP